MSSLFILPSKNKRKRVHSVSQQQQQQQQQQEAEERPGKVVCLTEKSKQLDVSFGLLGKNQSLARKREQMIVVSKMALGLYLSPTNVMHTVLYWLSQYVNYDKQESHWFGDHITKLMRYPVNFSIDSSHGKTSRTSKLVRHTLLIRIAGHELHKIPGDYFEVHGNTDLFEAIDYYILRAPEHFLVRNTHGLKGELELDGFIYNRLLAYFYEPSFLIITSYQVYVHYLFHMTGGRTLNDFLPTLRLIARPLEESRLAESLVLSLEKSHTNYTTKRETFVKDMRALREILALDNIKSIVDRIELLWSEKASEVASLAETRYAEIYSQVYAS